jgi:hypothetical protein
MRIFYHIFQLWPWKEINLKLLNLKTNIKACISSYFIKKKGKNQSPLFLMFFVNNSNELSTHIQHHKSKHLTMGDGSFFHLALGSWIWMHSRHHSTTNDPILVLNASNNNENKMFIIISDICHVNVRETWPMTLGPICLL